MNYHSNMAAVCYLEVTDEKLELPDNQFMAEKSDMCVCVRKKL